MPNSEPVVTLVSTLMPNLKSSIPYPLRRNDERRREKANDQIEKFYEIFKDLSFEISLTDALILMPKFASTLKALIGNKEKLSEMARTPLNEHCSAVILNNLDDLGASINSHAIIRVKKAFSSGAHSYFDSFLEEVDAFLALEDDSYYDPEGDILLLESLLNDDPSLPPPTYGNYLPEIRKELKVYEAKTDKKTKNLQLINLPRRTQGLTSYLGIQFLEGATKLPVIIAKDLSVEGKSQLS
ncbi:hypothetical protein Tco_0144375 [Tanacetum coccineum]